jgi:hypothetical protein
MFTSLVVGYFKHLSTESTVGYIRLQPARCLGHQFTHGRVFQTLHLRRGITQYPIKIQAELCTYDMFRTKLWQSYSDYAVVSNETQLSILLYSFFLIFSRNTRKQSPWTFSIPSGSNF